MIQLIVGHKGSGKTKTMIGMINEAINNAKGNIVCIEKKMKLTYDIKHSVRLIDVDEYAIAGYEMFYGFVAGVLAGNYDIEEVYIDGALKIGEGDIDGLSVLLERFKNLSNGSVKFIVTVSADMEELPDGIKKYL